MTEPKSKTIDTAWKHLFEKFRILKEIEHNGIFTISTEQIKTSGKEPRLMAKFDHKDSLPDIFKKTSLPSCPHQGGSMLFHISMRGTKLKTQVNPAQ